MKQKSIMAMKYYKIPSNEDRVKNMKSAHIIDA